MFNFLREKLKNFVAIIFFILCNLNYSQTIINGWRGNLSAQYPIFYYNDNKQLMEKSYGGSYGFDGFMASFLGARFQFDHLFFAFQNRGFVERTKTSMISTNLGFIIKPFPSWRFSPYLNFGGGGVYYYIQNSAIAGQSKNNLNYKANAGFGLEFFRTDKIILRFETDYNHLFTNKIDGNNYGSASKYDSYISLTIGISFLGRHKIDSVVKVSEVKQEIKIEPKLFEVIELPEIKEKEYDFLTTAPAALKKLRTFVKKDFIKFDSALVMSDVLFATGKASLRPEAVPIIMATYYWMKLNPEVEIEISGHTDNVGGKDYNLRLSKRRADAIKDLLVFLGIESKRIKTTGYGFSKPIASNKTPEGRAKNRRVEFKRIK